VSRVDRHRASKMNNTTNQPRGLSGAVAAAAFLFLLAFYVLSPGPVIWLCNALGYENSDFLNFVYAPRIWLYSAVPVVHKLYDSYFALFGVR
jgi:hypothetical protein